MLPSDFYKNEKKNNSKNVAKISNSLVNSFVKKNNLITLKILFYISSLKLERISDSEIQRFQFSVKDILAFCNIDLRTLRTNLKIMQETCITFIDFSIEGFARCGENITVIPYSKYDYKGLFEVKIFKKVLDLIVDVKTQFTIIDLNNLMNLKSKHSVRMIQVLEYINSFDSHIAKRKTYSLEELNQMFGTNYQRFKDFERKVLIPVQDELNEFSSLTYLYQLNFDKLEGSGRPKIVSVTLDLKSNKTRQLKLF